MSAPSTTHVFSVLSLSSGCRQELAEESGALQYETLMELRTLSPRYLLRRLRSIDSPHLLLVFENRASLSYLEYLTALACMTRASSFEVIRPDAGRQTMTRSRFPMALGRIGYTAVQGQLAVRSCNREARDLLLDGRVEPHRTSSDAVLFVKTGGALGFTAGGSVGHVAGVANALLRRGVKLDFMSQGHPSMVDAAASLHELQPLPVAALPYEASPYLFQQTSSRQILQHLQGKQYGFIYSRMSMGNYAEVLASRAAELPLVLEYNGSEPWAAEHYSGLRLRYHDVAVLTEEVCLKHAHVIVTVSEVLRDELESRGIEPRRIVCYPNCFDPKIFDPDRYDADSKRALRQRYGVAADATVVTFVGTFGNWHGVHVLARAIKGIVDHDPDWALKHKVRFLLVGDGQYMPLVREIIGTPTYTPFVNLTGMVPQDQAPAYLAASDILVASHVPNEDGSRFFGSPTKLFEYMAMGKGIVASDLDQIGQVLTNSVRVDSLPQAAPSSSEGRLAVLTKPGDQESLASGIRFLVEQPSWRARLGSNVREEALRHYSWDHHVDAVLRTLDEVIPRA